MTKLVKLTLLFVMALAVGAASAQTQIKTTWESAWTPCSTSTSAACSDHQTLTDVTVSGAPVVISSTIPANVTTFTTPIPVPNLYPTRLYTLVVTYRDVNGMLHDTSAATCGSANTAPPCAVTTIPVSNPPSATNFTGTVQ